LDSGPGFNAARSPTSSTARLHGPTPVAAVASWSAVRLLVPHRAAGHSPPTAGGRARARRSRSVDLPLQQGCRRSSWVELPVARWGMARAPQRDSCCACRSSNAMVTSPPTRQGSPHAVCAPPSGRHRTDSPPARWRLRALGASTYQALAAERSSAGDTYTDTRGSDKRLASADPVRVASGQNTRGYLEAGRSLGEPAWAPVAQVRAARSELGANAAASAHLGEQGYARVRAGHRQAAGAGMPDTVWVLQLGVDQEALAWRQP
jgi:hypothetical protein